VSRWQVAAGGGQGRATVIVTHRLRMSLLADAIIVLDRGRIVDAGDKEVYLERWRRIRLDLPAGRSLDHLPGTVSLAGEGRSRILTTSHFSEDIAAAVQAAGASIHAVERMTLEEIFVNTVVARREEAAQ